jgi:hypothetical protein
VHSGSCQAFARWRDGSRAGNLTCVDVDLAYWRHLLAADDGYELSPGVTADELAGVEAALGAVFPEALRQAYLASDGALLREGQYYPLWPLAEVLRRNQDDWSWDDAQRRHELVGFGDNGTGEPFCVDRVGSDTVYHWDLICSEATPLAETFAGFWAGWNAGTITT